jgi:hypothetical protein
VAGNMTDYVVPKVDVDIGGDGSNVIYFIPRMTQ